jgi:basic membrane protein A
MKRLLLIAAALLATTLTTTGGNASKNLEPRVGFVAYAGSVPTSHTLDGLSLVGFLRAEKQLSIRGRVAYISPTRGPGSVLQSLARQGYDLIIAPLFDPAPVVSVAKRFPDVRFLLVDWQPGTGRGKTIDRAVFRAEQGAYLAGYLAALMAQRKGGKPLISAVGGYPFYGVTRWIIGFRAGAKKADPRITVRVDYSKDFSNPSKCRRVALSQIAAGSRVIFDVAGACGVGALRAAREKGVWGIGVDVDQSFFGPHILTSAVMRLDRGVFDAVRRFTHRRLPPGAGIVYDVRNAGVQLGRISPKVPPQFLRRVERIRRQIADGTIRVPRPRG